MRKVCRVLALLMLADLGHAATTGDGLQVKSTPSEWQPWQARLVVNVPPLGWLNTSAALSGTAIAGDHYFEWGRLGESGGFRATGAVLWSASATLPASNSLAGPFQLARPARSSSLRAGETSEPTAMPYLGMGYSAAWPRQGLGLSADLGLLAQRPGSARVGRLLSGTDGFDDFARAAQMAPILQVQLSYAF